MEPTFNIFIYIEEEMIRIISVNVHAQDGADKDKMSFLRSRVNIDCHHARRFLVNPPFTWKQYKSMMRIGRHLEVFEPALHSLAAPQSPIMVITPMVGGYPSFLATTSLGLIGLSDLVGVGPSHRGTMLDYLQEYMVDGGFDIPRMLNDAFFRPSSFFLKIASISQLRSCLCLWSTHWRL
jgi:hypothetical protein